MSQAHFTIAYDGSALRSGSMEVRDLGPALLAIGSLFDAANAVLNHDSAKIKVNVSATETGSFEISFQIVQTMAEHVIAMLAGEPVTAAINLKELVAGSCGVIWLIKKLRGKAPEKLERLPSNHVRLTFGDQHLDVPMAVLELYQDRAVRAAVERVVAEPLKRDGIDKFEIRENKQPVVSVEKHDVGVFALPAVPNEIILQDTRRAAFSIISLAFKEDNKWRLSDGNSQISALIEDQEFLDRVDANQISFSKGDILLCDVQITQRRSAGGLSTEYVVLRVIEHKGAMRQIPFHLEPKE